MNINISVEVTYTSLAGVWLWLSDGTKLFNLFKQRTLLILVPRLNEFPLCPLTALANAYDLTRRGTLRSCLYVPPRDKTSDAYLPQMRKWMRGLP